MGRARVGRGGARKSPTDARAGRCAKVVGFCVAVAGAGGAVGSHLSAVVPALHTDKSPTAVAEVAAVGTSVADGFVVAWERYAVWARQAGQVNVKSPTDGSSGTVSAAGRLGVASARTGLALGR